MYILNLNFFHGQLTTSRDTVFGHFDHEVMNRVQRASVNDRTQNICDEWILYVLGIFRFLIIFFEYFDYVFYTFFKCRIRNQYAKVLNRV